MHAIVCIKSVPGTTQVRINPETNTLMRGEVEAVINPFDTYALEEALRLKESHGGRVTVVTMGPPQADKELREAVAMGCDEAVLLCSPELAGSDTWATAYTLAQAIRKLEPYDLVLCGKQAVDGDTGQVGPGIAAQLHVPQLTYVCKVRATDPVAGWIEVERLLEEGREVARAALPAVLTVVKDINQPRFPTPRGIRNARRATIPTWTPADLPELDRRRIGLEGSPTKVVRIFAPPQREKKVEMLSGDSVDIVAGQLVERLLADQVV